MKTAGEAVADPSRNARRRNRGLVRERTPGAAASSRRSAAGCPDGRRSFEAFAGSGIPIEEANAVWATLQRELAALSDNTQHLFSETHHRLNETDPAAVVRAIGLAVAGVKSPHPPRAPGLPSHPLPLRHQGLTLLWPTTHADCPQA